jgi:hypothetical protein
MRWIARPETQISLLQGLDECFSGAKYQCRFQDDHWRKLRSKDRTEREERVLCFESVLSAS